MYCSYLGYNCASSLPCENCVLWQNNNHYSWTFQYNYKCSCGGEFVTPATRFHLDAGKVSSALQNWKTISVCPFCGKEMAGLNE